LGYDCHGPICTSRISFWRESITLEILELGKK
jgi:hypothetical protein